MENFTVFIDDFDLSKIMTITDIRRDIGNERTISTANLVGLGSVVQNVYQEPKIIKIKFNIQSKNIQTVKRDLARRLNKDVVKLVITDEPNLYYLATVKGSVTIENVKNWFQKGEIDFLVPSGYAESTTTIPTSASFDEHGQLKATIYNNGTISCPIDYRIKFKSSGGYLGIVSDNGVIQVGAKNANTVNVDNDVRKLVIADSVNEGTLPGNWRVGGGYPSSPFPTSGTWEGVQKDGRKFVYPKTFGTGSTFHGATLWRKFSPDSSGTVGSKDFEVEGRLFFLNASGKEHGLQEVIISDSSGNCKVGFSIVKSSDGNKARIQFYNGETVGYQDIDTGSNNFVSWKTGGFRIKKIGRDINFSFNARANINYHVTTIDNVVFDTVTLVGMQSANYPTMARMWFEYIRVWRLKSSQSSESKAAQTNMFNSGDELFIDGNSGKVYLNGVLTSDINGSTWFDADVGQTDIFFYYSNYSTVAPEVVCEVRPRWL